MSDTTGMPGCPDGSGLVVDLMMMAVIAVAHEAVINEDAWAAIVAKHPALAEKREVLHSLADLAGAVQLAAMLEEAAAQAGPSSGQDHPAGWMAV